MVGGPIIFGIYENDLVEGVDSHINMFADDAKLVRRVQDESNCRKFQDDLNRIGYWLADGF